MLKEDITNIDNPFRYQTVSGHPVEIIYIDEGRDFPVIGLLDVGLLPRNVMTWKRNGAHLSSTSHDLDLTERPATFDRVVVIFAPNGDSDPSYLDARIFGDLPTANRWAKQYKEVFPQTKFISAQRVIFKEGEGIDL